MSESDVEYDFSSPRVNQIIAQFAKTQQSKPLRQPNNKIQGKLSYLRHASERKWLKKKGKNYLIDFDQQERQQMKKFFNTLDKKKTGSIGLDQLQEMLLSVGLSESREEVKELMGSVDEDHSGKIQFQQFLQMIKDDSQQNQKIVSFFKKLASKHVKNIESLNRKKKANKKQAPKEQNEEGYLQEQKIKDIPFEMIINQIRRSYILSSLNVGRCKVLNEKENEQVQKGKKVVQALQKMEERRIIRALHEQNQIKFTK